jgi:hypothetical protein
MVRINEDAGSEETQLADGAEVGVAGARPSDLPLRFVKGVLTG